MSNQDIRKLLGEAVSALLQADTLIREEVDYADRGGPGYRGLAAKLRKAEDEIKDEFEARGEKLGQACIEGDDIVFRVRIDHLATIVANAPDDPGFTVTSAAAFAPEVVRELNTEVGENQPTVIQAAFDRAMLIAFENGAEGAESASTSSAHDD